ncbi:tail fiber assembly protein [Enterobacter asburiae]|uniref:tail fiber assembly protein n=1 Tax=Enterobacter asburiae TaxID=61645 RepID=UPI0029DCE602|nr:tail fiber assembly protein [Enterobacter asburiae]MDX7665236.1 tail fiber assembly protein [Enterobacter asburiae]
MKIFYSPLFNGFLLESTAHEYKGKDLVEVTQDTYDKFLAGSKTQLMVPGDNGPAWADIPPPTHDELVAAAEAEKQQRIDLANEFMNSKQWPGKAAIGRLRSDELTQYNLWLDYLDEVESVNVDDPQNIIWPQRPEI